MLIPDADPVRDSLAELPRTFGRTPAPRPRWDDTPAILRDLDAERERERASADSEWAAVDAELAAIEAALATPRPAVNWAGFLNPPPPVARYRGLVVEAPPVEYLPGGPEGPPPPIVEALDPLPTLAGYVADLDPAIRAPFVRRVAELCDVGELLRDRRGDPMRIARPAADRIAAELAAPTPDPTPGRLVALALALFAALALAAGIADGFGGTR